MTRVTALEPSGNLYGSEYCLLDILEGTSRTFDWDVVLPGGGGFDSLLESKGIPVARLLKRDSHTLPLASKLASYWSVRRHISRNNPAVVYVNQAGMLRSANAMTSGLGVELVCQVQTLEDAKFVAEHRDAQSRVRTFICNSKFIAAHAGVPREKTTVLYQPMMTKNQPSMREPLPAGPQWRVGILGRISESKGHYLLLDAAKRLLSKERTDIRFVVIGSGLTPADTSRFESAVSEAGLSQFFDLRGYQSAAHDELATLHLVVIPSIAEPFGRVLLDAAATGRPVVVSDGGGLGELNRHFDIGRSFRSGNAESFADAIAGALASFEADTASFQQSAARMLERLNPDKYIEAVTTVISNAAVGRSTAMEWLGEA
ncbi:MAG: glycosyltransferase [Gemmatimonadales bacterium]